MLLFPKEEHEKIKRGEITVTFRDWDKLRVEPGKDYKSFNLGFVRVNEIGFIDLKKIPPEDLEAAGFPDMDEFKAVFRKRNPGFNFGSGRVIRIAFSYLGAENRTAGGLRPNDRELIRIMERLVDIDVMSELSVKSDDILSFIQLDKAVNSTSVAEHFGISREEARKCLVQLKKEGLIVSRRDGYTLTVRGKTYLDSKI
jgi:hypothetical protein